MTALFAALAAAAVLPIVVGLPAQYRATQRHRRYVQHAATLARMTEAFLAFSASIQESTEHLNKIRLHPGGFIGFDNSQEDQR